MKSVSLGCILLAFVSNIFGQESYDGEPILFESLDRPQAAVPFTKFFYQCRESKLLRLSDFQTEQISTLAGHANYSEVKSRVTEENPRLAKPDFDRVFRRELLLVENGAMQEVKDILSDNQYQLAIQIMNQKYLSKPTSKDDGHNYDADLLLLTRPSIKNHVGISSSQEGKLRKHYRVYWSQYEAKRKAFFEQLATDHRLFWSKLKDVLDTTQRTKYEQLMGQPLQYFRIAFEGTSTIHFREPGTAYFGETHGTPPSPEFRKRFKTEHGVDFPRRVPYYWSRLINQPFVWDELELSPAQRRQFKSLARDIVTKCWCTTHDDRFKQMLNGEVGQPEVLNAVLLPVQVELLTKIETQIRAGAFRDSFGLLHPYISEALSLTDEQVSQIGSLVSHRNDKLLNTVVEFTTDVCLHRQDAFQECLKVLNETQVAFYLAHMPSEPKQLFPIPKNVKERMVELADVNKRVDTRVKRLQGNNLLIGQFDDTPK